jgi:hypothetical protein
MIGCVFQIRLDRDLLAGLVPGFAAIMSAIEVLKEGVPCPGHRFFCL